MKVLFIYPNTYGMNMLPPAIAMFSAILKKEGHQTQIFDTTYYSFDYGMDSDGSKMERLNVVPFKMESKGIRLKTSDWKIDLKKQVESFKPDLLAISSTEDMWELAMRVLEELKDYSENRLSVIEGDALNIDLINLTPQPRRIIANLPYNIASKLLIKWLKQVSEYTGFTLMFQREVAQRITAKPNTKSYGRLSIICQLLTETRQLFDVAPSSFFPSPSVTSTVIAMETRDIPLASADINKLELVTRLAFGQRRKMLRRSLQSVGGSELLLRAHIQETMRAEDLTVEQYCDIANSL